jgi:hypothetical protein
MLISTAGGGSIMLTFVDGSIVAETKNEDGTQRRFMP